MIPFMTDKISNETQSNYNSNIGFTSKIESGPNILKLSPRSKSNEIFLFL